VANASCGCSGCCCWLVGRSTQAARCFGHHDQPPTAGATPARNDSGLEKHSRADLALNAASCTVVGWMWSGARRYMAVSSSEYQVLELILEPERHLSDLCISEVSRTAITLYRCTVALPVHVLLWPCYCMCAASFADGFIRKEADPLRFVEASFMKQLRLCTWPQFSE
jgi:hypothetical protein